MPYVLQGASEEPLGYYTLSCYSISAKELPPSIAKRLPPYPEVPAILLGRLAIHQDLEGKGYGKALLVEALERCFKISKTVGALGVVVDAIDEKANAWYQKFGFAPFPDSKNRLFLPMSTISELVGALPQPQT